MLDTTKYMSHEVERCPCVCVCMGRRVVPHTLKSYATPFRFSHSVFEIQIHLFLCSIQGITRITVILLAAFNFFINLTYNTIIYKLHAMQ